MKAVPRLRRFGRTGLSFPEIGLGTWTFSGKEFGPINDRDRREVVAAALERGIRFIDTADVYGYGSVEDFLGDTVSSERNVFLATKAGNDFRHGSPSVKNFQADYIREAIDASARRLKRPWLDLLQLHNPGAAALKDAGLLDALEVLKGNGKLRHLGVSLTEADELEAVIASKLFDAIQLPFNILRQNLILEHEDALRSWGGAIIVRTPLEFGLLSGRLPPSDDLAPADYRRRAWKAGEELSKRSVAKEIALALADETRSLPQLALQFALLPKAVSIVIPGSRNVAQLNANIAASASVPPMTLDDAKVIDRIMRDHGRRSAVETVFRAANPSATVRSSGSAGPAPKGEKTSAFTPLSLGPITLDNRVFRSGTTERGANDQGCPTPEFRQLYHRFAEGGAGLVVTGYLAVTQGARASTSHCVLENSAQEKSWRSLLRECKALNPRARFCAQLSHGGALAIGDVSVNTLYAFGEAASRSVSAGFDAVQIHCAHGYYLNQLLSGPPRLSRSPARHEGLETLLSIVRLTKQRIGANAALLVKLGCSDFMVGGYDQEDASIAVKALLESGVDAIEISGWTTKAAPADTPSRLGDVHPDSEGFFLPFCASEKQRHPRLVIGTCGGFRSLRGINGALEQGHVDFVSLARPFIAEPDLPNRLRNGQARASCDGCNLCLPRNGLTHCPRVELRAQSLEELGA
jgi:aryl-alcohol dehydrogenase-like predicted oxidoreductase/2,4-dienoyl-CoA reductase-like NADH-dependent reductase (Old Yellow Enzyme family)